MKRRRAPLWTPGQTLAHSRCSGNWNPHGPLCLLLGVFTHGLASFPGGETWWRAGLFSGVVGRAELLSGWVTGQGQEDSSWYWGGHPSCLHIPAPSALPEGAGRGEPESHRHMGLSLLLNGTRLPRQVPEVLMEVDYSATSARRLWCSPAQTLPVRTNHPAAMLAQLPPGASPESLQKKLRPATAAAGQGPPFEKEATVFAPQTPA